MSLSLLGLVEWPKVIVNNGNTSSDTSVLRMSCFSLTSAMPTARQVFRVVGHGPQGKAALQDLIVVVLPCECFSL